MDLIYLVVGVGVGLLGSRLTRSIKEPKKPMVSTSIQEAKEPVVSTLSVPQGAQQENLQPLKEELKQTQLAYQMAKHMSQFKGGFLARTAHELRSPLSSLIGMHQLILSDLCDSPEEAREFVAQANASALKMVKLLDEVIAVAKLEQGKAQLEIGSVGLTKIFEEVHRLTHLQAANNNLQLAVVPPDPEIYVLADSRRLLQVLVGLVDSAIAQMEERKEGSIKVSATSSTESQEGHIWIDVQSPTPIWREAVDILSTTPEMKTKPGETSIMSPGLTLLMVQSLVEVMQGSLEALAVSGEDTAGDAATEHFTRLQCSMPLATPETVEQALVADP